MAKSRKHTARGDDRPRDTHDESVSRVPGTPWYRRISWTAIALTAVVLLTSTCAVDPIRDAVTLGDAGEARLSQTAAYLAIAPVSNVLDTLTLLTVGQHIAIVVWAMLIFAAVRLVRARLHGTTGRSEAIASVVFLVCLVAAYAAAAMAPRPMAQLVISDQAVFAIDFHAHTKYSHDGRPGWEPGDVRDWHTGAGYDVAYITDHRTFEGAERGIAMNPSQAGQGEGTMLLEGLEAVSHGVHVNVLNAGRRYKGLTTADLRDIDEQSMALASIILNNEPVIIQTIPDDITRIAAAGGPGTPGVRGIELIDGSPRGLSQGRRDRARIIRLADSLNLALVVGSDNHGWGRAAPGWTLMRIPGWRGMGTDSLAGIIETALRLGRRESTKVIERRVADATTPVGIVFTGVSVPWRMFTTLTPDERVVWIIWVWAVVLIRRGRRAFRIRPSTTT